jgi:hypothetical protein
LLAAGQPAWIVQVYATLNVAAWLVLAGILWRILGVSDFRGWLAWAGVLFSAGALASVRLALTDLVALTFVAGAMLACERGRMKGALMGLAAAGLSRETSLLAVVGLFGSARPSIRASKADEENPTAPHLGAGTFFSLADGPIARCLSYFSRQNVGRALVVAGPLAIWLAYVLWRVGPADAGWGNFSGLLTAFWSKWRAGLTALNGGTDVMLAWTSALGLAGLTLQAIYIAIRWDFDDAWWRIGAAYAAMMAFLGESVWDGFPGAAHRVLLPMTLAFNVLAKRRGAGLAWLVAGNLAVFSGLLTLKDVPTDSREIAAGRAGGADCVVRVGDGWFGCERTWRHTWSWCGGTGRIDFGCWPRDSRTVLLAFDLRSLVSRTVTVRQDGRECWKGTVGTGKTSAQVEVRLSGGRSTLDFSTDTPAVPEAADPGARRLAFAIYDPSLHPSQMQGRIEPGAPTP